MSRFRFKLRFAAEPSLFQEKPDVGTEPSKEITTKEDTGIETKMDEKPDGKEEGKDKDIGEDIGSIGFGDFGDGDSGGDIGGDVGKPAVPQIAEKTPREILDEKSKETVKTEVKKLKELQEIEDPEEIKSELEDEGWEEERLLEIFDMSDNGEKLEDAIRDAGNRREMRIGKIIRNL